jgi:tetratricopeptide (TPR) repeat protein
MRKYFNSLIILNLILFSFPGKSFSSEQYPVSPRQTHKSKSVSSVSKDETKSREETKGLHGKSQEGLLLLKNKKYGAAVDYFKAKASREPEDAGAYYYLGYSYYKKGEFLKAVSNFKKSFLLNPNFSPDKIAPKPSVFFEEHITVSTKTPASATAKEQENNLKGTLRLQPSIKTAKTAVKEETPEQENMFSKSLTALYRKDYSEAEKQLRELIENQKDSPKYHYYLGQVLYSQKRMAEAIKEFQISYALDPEFSRSLPAK